MKSAIKPSFNYKDCINCSMCVQACPVSALSMSRRARNGKYKNQFPELNDYQDCIGCKQCESACPMDCITMTDNEDN